MRPRLGFGIRAPFAGLIILVNARHLEGLGGVDLPLGQGKGQDQRTGDRGHHMQGGQRKIIHLLQRPAQVRQRFPRLEDMSEACASH